MATDDVIRVFISSPGDVRAERRRAALVCNRLSREFGRFFEVQPVLWEYEPLLASGHFQDVVEPAPSDADIVAVILWSKLGTPLPVETDKRRYEGIDGRSPVTGTEWEFEDALRARQERIRRGEPATPDLIVYKSEAATEARSLHAEGLRRAAEQLEALQAFWHRHFEEPNGQFKLAYATYLTVDDFEARFEEDLRNLLRQRLPETTTPRGTAAPDDRIAWHQGSPFRGLQAFDFEHSAIYFGRAEDQRRVIDALVGRAEAGAAFVLVLGASGTGKSSLARAGVAPDLTVPGVVGRVEAWRRVVLRPATSGAAGDLFFQVADTLAEAVPELNTELTRLGPEAGTLAERLRNGTARDLLRAAFYRAAEESGLTLLTGEPPPVRLLVIVDQLEELFTAEEQITPETRGAFVELLAMLAASGVVWVLATMRSDFYSRLAELPVLRELVAGDGQQLLAPPSGAQLRQMIELPALAAGITYEKEDKSGISLASRLLEEAQGPGALPLLEFALDELYARDIAGNSANTNLTLASYDAMGGLRGALAHQAEVTVSALGAAYEDALRSVLLALVTQRPDGAPTARTTRKMELASTSERARVVDALIGARLLVGDNDETDASVRLAHEALLTSWPRYGGLIAAESDFLRARDRVAARAALWNEEGELDGRLMDGIDLAEGRQMLADRYADLSPTAVRFIDASLYVSETRRAAELAGERKKRRIYQVLGGVAASLAIIAWIGGWVAYQNQREAVHMAAIAQNNAKEARLSQEKAESSRLSAQRNESRYWAAEANLLRKNGHVSKAIALAWLGLPHEHRLLLIRGMSIRMNIERYGITEPLSPIEGGLSRPLVPEALRALASARDDLAERNVFVGHESAISSSTFGPDGRTILTGSYDSTARLWDVATGSEVKQFVGGEHLIHSVAFSPDGRTVLTGSDDSTAQLWDVATGAEVRRLVGHKGTVFAVAFSPDGRTVLTGSDDSTAQLWDVATGAEVRRLVGHKGTVFAVAFSPDSQTVLTGSSDNTARLWDVAAGKELKQFGGHEEGVRSVAFSPNGLTVLTGSWDSTARLWAVATGQELKRFGSLDAVLSVAFSPDGRTVLTGSSDKTARLWNVATGVELRRFNHDGAVFSVAFSPDRQTIVTGSRYGLARLWDSAWYTEAKRFGSLDAVLSVAFSPDGRTVLTVAEDNTARLWDVATGKELKQFADHEDGIRSVAFSPDGATVLTGSDDSMARLWDVMEEKELKRFVGHNESIMSVAFSPDSQTMLTGSADQTARLWDVATGEELEQFVGHEDVITSVAFSPDGRTVLTGSQDWTARLWDVATGTELQRFAGHESFVEGVAFSPDGRTALTGSFDETARLWDVATGAEVRRFVGHGDGIDGLAFSPDGLTVLTWANDKTARLWDVTIGAEVKRFDTESQVVSATFSPDGQRILALFYDATAEFWRNRRPIAAAIQQAGKIVERLRPLSVADCAHYGVENNIACRPD